VTHLFSKLMQVSCSTANVNSIVSVNWNSVDDQRAGSYCNEEIGNAWLDRGRSAKQRVAGSGSGLRSLLRRGQREGQKGATGPTVAAGFSKGGLVIERDHATHKAVRVRSLRRGTCRKSFGPEKKQLMRRRRVEERKVFGAAWMHEHVP
jgi:hypothetical protein